MSLLGTETAFEVLARAQRLEAQGRDIIHLEIGEPDFETPANIIEAGIRALNGGATHYGPSLGLPSLREAIAEEVGRTRGISVSPEEVVVVPGGKPIIFFTILALVETGDEVIYPNPGFPIYESMIRFAGGVPVALKLREENDFRPDFDDLSSMISDRTKLIILNSPQNPTGGTLSESDLSAVAAAIGDRNIMVLSDEIYSRLVFDGDHYSLMSLPDFRPRTILLDGFSKTYAMTGWRLGFGVMRPDLAVQMGRLIVNSNSCTASFTQMAGLEALRGEQSAVERMRSEFQLRRDVFVKAINRVKGFKCRLPRGAFYTFPNIQETGWSSKDLAAALLDEAGVACLSGTDFGIHGEGYLRFSIANSVENITNAIERIEAWTRKRL
jgi:aspartate aminotransferase